MSYDKERAKNNKGGNCCSDLKRERNPPESVEDLIDCFDLLIEGDIKRKYIASRRLTLFWGEQLITGSINDNELIRAAISQRDESDSMSDSGVVFELAMLMIWAHEAYMKHWKQNQEESDARFDQLLDRAIVRVDSAKTEQQREEAIKKFARLSAHGIGSAWEVDIKDEWLVSISGSISQIFMMIGELILDDPDAICLLLGSKSHAHCVLMAIKTIAVQASGGRELEVYPILLDELMKDDGEYKQDLEEVIGLLAKNDDDCIRCLIGLIDDLRQCIADRAVRALTFVGARAAEVDPCLIERFAERIRIAQGLKKKKCDCQVGFWINNLSKVAVGNVAISEWFLDMGESHIDQYQVAELIDAVGELGVASGRAVNWLIKMFDEFEEFDYDLMHEGDHERVCMALAKLGSGAAIIATPELTMRIHREDQGDGLDREVLRALAAFGPAASQALPELEKLAAEDEYCDLDDEMDHVTVALKSIRSGGEIE